MQQIKNTAQPSAKTNTVPPPFEQDPGVIKKKIKTAAHNFQVEEGLEGNNGSSSVFGRWSKVEHEKFIEGKSLSRFALEKFNQSEL